MIFQKTQISTVEMPRVLFYQVITNSLLFGALEVVGAEAVVIIA